MEFGYWETSRTSKESKFWPVKYFPSLFISWDHWVQVTSSLCPIFFFFFFRVFESTDGGHKVYRTKKKLSMCNCDIISNSKTLARLFSFVYSIGLNSFIQCIELNSCVNNKISHRGKKLLSFNMYQNYNRHRMLAADPGWKNDVWNQSITQYS